MLKKWFPKINRQWWAHLLFIYFLPDATEILVEKWGNIAGVSKNILAPSGTTGMFIASESFGIKKDNNVVTLWSCSPFFKGWKLLVAWFISGFANRIAHHFLFEKKHSPCLSLELSEKKKKKKEHSNLRLIIWMHRVLQLYLVTFEGLFS